MVVTNCVNGLWFPWNPEVAVDVGLLQQLLHALWSQGHIRLRESHARFIDHVYRELNKEADALATSAFSSNPQAWVSEDLSDMVALQVSTDGGKRGRVSTYGWRIVGIPAWHMFEAGWRVVGYGFGVCGMCGETSVTRAEAFAIRQALEVLWSLKIYKQENLTKAKS